MNESFSFGPVDPRQSFPEVEKDVLDFWQREKIFERSVEQRKDGPRYVFFDGPPFANGLPHYGHILASALKDAVTRYWTMRGFYIPRANGWDCHGLPVEYEIEKELKLAGRKEIEEMGVEKFNDACRESVFRYTAEWEVLLRRIGRWVDFENSYATLNSDYMESIWWVISEIWKKGMIYEGHRSMHICPRCETPLSNFEVTLGYKDVADLSVTFKLPVEGKAETYLLAWTTTPWTIPGNALLAVNPEIDYDYVRVWRKEDGSYALTDEEEAGPLVEEQVILAHSRVESMMSAGKKGSYRHELVSTVKGSELAGLRYEPATAYYKDWENAFRVVADPLGFVTDTDGTGIVHIAPGYGDDDMEVGKREDVAPIMHVKMDGTFKDEVTEYAGRFVKDVENEIARQLLQAGRLFRKDPLNHSYPHCWRCDTPLLNYATKAWFIRVTEIKDKMLANNQKISWVPEHIRDGRFGKWLEGARDWNISRNRFWGCPIPIWQCECGNQAAISSVKELNERALKKTTLLLVRHGEADNNIQGILNSDPTKEYHLTEKGREQTRKRAAELAERGASAIYHSPLIRTSETAQLLNETLNVPTLKADERLREHGLGGWEGCRREEYLEAFSDIQDRYAKSLKGSETFKQVEQRVAEAINEIAEKHRGETVIIVVHGDVQRAAARYVNRLSHEETFEMLPEHGGLLELSIGQLPTRNNQLDLHKPYIDEIKLRCDECQGEMSRVPDVLDCWVESGSMPYAQLHYPFDNKKAFEENFPAHFIAEGLDQTRGWFYTLHVIATILFDEPAFQNIIVNGILLAADGEKLSKRKKNYPDPNLLFDTHGVDSTRLFLYTSTAPLAEDVRFSEQHVEELVKKFTLTLWNTYSFFVTYATIDGWKPAKEEAKPSENKLDQWILSELNTLVREVTEQMNGYNLTRATRPLVQFVDILSNWYVRRSRRRFWKSESDQDKNDAYATLHKVLVTFSQLIAPFTPFLADSLYKNLTGEESVHLSDWPTATKTAIDEKLNEEVRIVRTIVTLALRLRGRHTIKVRQPLALLRLALPQTAPANLVEEYREVICEEINVKDISVEEGSELALLQVIPDSRKIGPRFGKETQELIGLCKEGRFSILDDGSVAVPSKEEARYTLNPDEVSIGYQGREGADVESEDGILVSLDTTITEKLRREGEARDLIRQIQELRKKANYDLSDRIYLSIKGGDNTKTTVTQFAELIKKETLAHEIQESGDFEWDSEEKMELAQEEVTIGVRKA
ncbi:hypothetical protein CO046_01860 [Candidatus Peregrinibacteria bacterium CG_4_9_14_0_2_um_filter_53_11]|nr:MAG: hypothetical protein CO046_01860 [Candidatus Peregrinibacteria bacterium CG_4_9_14_0_2_um_filter_53_11]